MDGNKDKHEVIFIHILIRMQKMAEQWFQHQHTLYSLHCTILKFLSSTKSFQTLQLEADEKQRVRTRPSVQQGKLALLDSCMLNAAVHCLTWCFSLLGQKDSGGPLKTNVRAETNTSSSTYNLTSSVCHNVLITLKDWMLICRVDYVTF